MNKVLLITYTLALMIRIAIAIPFLHDWDGFVFSESAKNLLQGETPYQTVVKNSPEIYPDSDRPMTQQWYAYPPLPLLMFTVPVVIAQLAGSASSPEIVSLLIKIPFILGDLVAARLVYLYLRNKGSTKASLAEKLILFNPLIIWVSSAWGMFDIWIFNFIVLSLMSVETRRWKLAGLFFALSISIKLFPVFLLPLFAKLIWSETKINKERIYVLLSFFVSLIIINLPFFISSPQGFMQQNLLMHLARPAQGISIPALIDIYGHIYGFSTRVIVNVFSILMLLSLMIIYLYNFIVKVDTTRFIFLSSLTYISILLFNKVTNEQYFVVIVSFLLLYIFSNKEHSKSFIRTVKFNEIAATLGALVAAFFLGFHFVSFILPIYADSFFGLSTNQIVFQISKYFKLPLYAYPETVFTFYNFPVFITTLVLIPFYISALYILASYQIYQIKMISLKIHEIVSNFAVYKLELFQRRNVYFGCLTISLLLLAVLSLSTFVRYMNKEYSMLKPVTLLKSSDYAPLPPNPRIGTFYNVWWNNFSHNQTYPYDAWNLTTLTPADGYYTSKNSYFVKNIREMKEAGIDFAAVSYHLYDRNRYLTFTSYADQMGMYYAPLIEIGDALNYDEFRPTSNEGSKFLGFNLSLSSRKQVKSIIISSIVKTYDSPGHLKIDDKPVIFLYDSHWFFPSWDKESKEILARRIVSMHSDDKRNPFETISERWGKNIDSVDSIITYYPKDIIGFNDSTPQSEDFRKAFLDEYSNYWHAITKEVEKEVGPIYFVASYTPDRANWMEYAIHAEDFQNLKEFDAEFFYSPANTWSMYRFSKPEDKITVWIEQVGEQAKRADTRNAPLFVPVIPQYNDTKIRKSMGFTMPAKFDNVSLYDVTWLIASQYQADYFLITSWNEHFEGTAIEPSKENGKKYISETRKWVDTLKRNNLTLNQD
jgi:alpha-1,6-mannosyltransferase